MKANSWGINAQDADRHMLRMYGAYIRSNEGSQDFRNLVELEYDQSIPFEKRKQMAEMDIKKRMQSFARAHMHTRVMSTNKDAQEQFNAQMHKLNAMTGGGSSIQTGNVSFDASGVGKPSMTETTETKIASKILEDIVNGNTQEAADGKAALRRVADNLFANQLITAEQYAAHKENSIELFDLFRSAGGYSDRKSTTLEAYIKYATTNVPFGDATGLDPYMAQALEDVGQSASNVLGPSAGISIGMGLLNLAGTNLPAGAFVKGGAAVTGGYSVAKI